MAKTFGELLELSIERAAARGCEPATLKTYRYQTDRFLAPALGEKKLKKLKPEHFEKLYARMAAEDIASSTIRKCKATATLALGHAERKGWIKTNPVRLAELPKFVQRQKKWPTPEEVRAFLDVAAEKDADMHDYAHVIAATGARPGEACAMMRADLDGSTLTIERALDVCQGRSRIKSTKTGRIRRLTIDDQTAWIITHRQVPYLFGGDQPERTDLMSKRFRRVARKAHVNFTPRNLRHYHATQLIANGVDIKTVADRLGHTNPNTTAAFYIGSVPANDARAASLIASTLPNASDDYLSAEAQS